MNEPWYDSLYDKTYKLYDRIDYYVDYFYENIHKKVIKFYTRLNKRIESIYELSMLYYPIFRKITFPTNYFLLKAWRYLKKLLKPMDLLLRKGIHVIISEPGGGKTLSAFLTAEIMYEKRGFTAAINSPFEKPRTDEFGRKFTHHTLFRFEDIFGIRLNFQNRLEGYQKKRFNAKKTKIIIWDELHMIFNPRENRSSIYMLSWKPWLINLLHYRHEGFWSHICLSQLKVDIQLASVATYIHKPKTILDVNYALWQKTGKFKIVPVKIKYETYKFKDGEMKLHKKWSRHVDYNHLEYYETLALKNLRTSIPMLY
jgi:hypothetical protein